MTLEKQSIALLQEALERLNDGFSSLPGYEPDLDSSAVRDVLLRVAERMQDNYPYQHPLYAGQMLKPPHPIARLAYMLAMWINPNNHALDGGRASSAMEKEAVAELATMFGWDTHLGHLTSGGTLANLEGLWVANRVDPHKAVIASNQAHYTHQRLSGVLGIPFAQVQTDARGRMNVAALQNLLETGKVGTVVATMGTTATGSVDPLPEILALREQYDFRIHADAAYGGYFILANYLRPETQTAFEALSEVDSIAIDPHKHGLQPYGCGCILFKEPTVGQYYKHDSPYTYFTSDELHLGEITLECSRAGASAVGLWATQQLLPLEQGGELGQSLSRGRQAALDLYEKLASDKRFVTAFEPDLDIVVWAIKGDSIVEASTRAQQVFDACAQRNLHLALVKLPTSFFPVTRFEGEELYITCLRSCLMKPDHLDWMPQIWSILDEATDEVLKKAAQGPE